MREFVENLIVAVVTAVIVSFLTLDIPKHMLITIVTLLTFIPCKYLVDRAVGHIKNKKMPTVYQWVRYAAVLLATIFMIVSFVYNNMACTILMIVLAIVAIIAKFIEHYIALKATKESK